jgi:hypothetical protein
MIEKSTITGKFKFHLMNKRMDGIDDLVSGRRTEKTGKPTTGNDEVAVAQEGLVIVSLNQDFSGARFGVPGTEYLPGDLIFRGTDLMKGVSGDIDLVWKEERHLQGILGLVNRG